MAASWVKPFTAKLAAAAPQTPFTAAGTKAVVVGGTNGIGLAIAMKLAAEGADVTIVGRSNRAEGVANIRFVKADLESMAAAKACAASLPAEAVQLLVFTQGILSEKERQETAEGLEFDMAISALSRLVMLREMAPRMQPGARVFVMGFPGTPEKLPDADDLNAEKAYSQFPQHSATVVVNEAIVLDGAVRYPSLSVFGLNPGLIMTGIRSPVVGTGIFAKAIEGCIGCLNPSADDYATTIVPVLLAPGLAKESGFHFYQTGKPIEANPNLTVEAVTALIGASDALLAKVAT
jgi:NAD(P)-dependent dehydrogenase (short-subunit alcohol dehydrogenase family)